LIQLSTACEGKGLSGVEFLCHIPGTLGGAVMMNAGFGRPDSGWREIKDILESVTVMAFNGSVQTIAKEQIEFEYRKTRLPVEGVVLEVLLQLHQQDRKNIQEEVQTNFRYRNSVQDLTYPSAGSTFKNPKGSCFSSGQLLDQAHMKGERAGKAMVSKKHANFILNMGQASARDVLALMTLGRKRVFESFGVQLEPEVKYIA